MTGFFPYARRTYKEFLRDPVSLIFGAAFPVILMIILQIVCKNLGDMGVEVSECYRIDRQMIGIAIYSFSFTSFYAGFRLSKDRNDEFIQRFYNSKMELEDYILAYIMPLMLVTFIQSIMCITTAFLLDTILNLNVLHFGFNYILLVLMMLPCELIFVCIGLMLGISFKARESFSIFIGIIIVTILTSNSFFNVTALGKGYEIFCYILPFYPTYTGLSCIINGITEAFPYYYITIGYVLVLLVLTILIFKKKMHY